MSEFEQGEWREWVECPDCEKNDEVTISIRPRSVGIWCHRCDTNVFYDK